MGGTATGLRRRARPAAREATGQEDSSSGDTRTTRRISRKQVIRESANPMDSREKREKEGEEDGFRV